MRIANTIEIAAPIARVWSLTVDVESWPRMTPTVTRAAWMTAPPVRVGSQARLKQPAQRARVWTVTRFDPERSFVWSTKSLGIVMTGSHHMEPTKSGTKNTVQVDLEGPLGWLVGVLFRRMIRNAITQENEGFRVAAEGAVATRHSAGPG